MPCCSILFADSEYTTLFEMPSILSELQLKIDLFSVKVTIQRLNPAKLNRLISSSTSKPSCCTPGPVASDLMIKAFPFDQANSAYQVASFHTICDVARVWGGPRATKHTKTPPNEEARLPTELS